MNELRSNFWPAFLDNVSLSDMVCFQAKTAKEVYTTLKEGKPEEKMGAMEKLSRLSADITFAMEFITNEGLDLIKQFVRDSKL